jgi:paraquat-inducible protein B
VGSGSVVTEPNDSLDMNSLPSAVAHRSRRSRLPLVWLVPLIAAFIGGWIAVRAVVDRGPTINVSFIDADGIEPGKTKVRYKSVEVGSVKAVTLAADLRTVNVTIDMAKFARPLLVSSTRFWIVRPRLGASGVSGLGTLLSGAFIGMDVGHSGETTRTFAGLETPPVIAGGAAGTQYVLEAQDLGSLGVGAPAYFHHIRVGQISSLSLNSDGHGVTLGLFIEAPYDRFVSGDTRFWHASGVDVAVDSSGVHMQTESLTAILAGGVALESPPESTTTDRAAPDSHFRLAANRDAAMKAPDRVIEPYVLYFEESLRGLAPGAIVDFRGVNIGEVTALNVEYDGAKGTFRFPVLINVYPERIRARYRAGGDRPQTSSYKLVAHMIENGFRAQLRTASLLTGQLYIALDFFPRSAPVAPQPMLVPMPLPTLPGNLEELQNTIVSVAHKIDQLPLAKIGRDVDDALVSLNRALGSPDGVLGKLDKDILPELKSTLTQARMTLAQTQQTLAPETALQSDLHATLTSISRAADSMRVLADYLDAHPESLLRGKPEERK